MNFGGYILPHLGSCFLKTSTSEGFWLSPRTYRGVGLIYGPMTTTFQRCEQLEERLAFSVSGDPFWGELHRSESVDGVATPLHSQVRWQFVQGAMINQDIHGSGDRRRS